ncbi:MAG: response regulator transcription factor [Peptococcaceae bacterium]|nr:response regulator transcription factor [Peptococcaceae bacterium]
MSKVVIVEDDSFFRKELASKVASAEGMEITGVFDRGEEFLSQRERFCPDILFLDIGLPGISGIQVAESVRRDFPMLDIIFITADEHHTHDAFRLYATDYITKPLDAERLNQTLMRIKSKTMMSNLKIELKTQDSIEVVEQKNIFFVEAFMKKSMVYMVNATLTSLQSIKEIESRLDCEMFFKSSRSFLVNMRLVESIKPASRTMYQVSFKGIDSCAYLQKDLYSEFRSRIKNLN